MFNVNKIYHFANKRLSVCRTNVAKIQFNIYNLQANSQKKYTKKTKAAKSAINILQLSFGSNTPKVNNNIN